MMAEAFSQVEEAFFFPNMGGYPKLLTIAMRSLVIKRRSSSCLSLNILEIDVANELTHHDYTLERCAGFTVDLDTVADTMNSYLGTTEREESGEKNGHRTKAKANDLKDEGEENDVNGWEEGEDGWGEENEEYGEEDGEQYHEDDEDEEGEEEEEEEEEEIPMDELFEGFSPEEMRDLMK